MTVSDRNTQYFKITSSAIALQFGAIALGVSSVALLNQGMNTAGTGTS
ncbi:hypothetical protein [Microcoleus sp. MON2_D5]